MCVYVCYDGLLIWLIHVGIKCMLLHLADFSPLQFDFLKYVTNVTDIEHPIFPFYLPSAVTFQ